MLLESNRHRSILPSGRRPCTKPSFSFWCCRCRARRAPACLRFTARSTGHTTGTTGIHRPQFLLMPLTALLWAVGAVATAIRQITNAEDRPICVKPRAGASPQYRPDRPQTLSSSLPQNWRTLATSTLPPRGSMRTRPDTRTTPAARRQRIPTRCSFALPA